MSVQLIPGAEPAPEPYSSTVTVPLQITALSQGFSPLTTGSGSLSVWYDGQDIFGDGSAASNGFEMTLWADKSPYKWDAFTAGVDPVVWDSSNQAPTFSGNGYFNVPGGAFPGGDSSYDYFFVAKSVFLGTGGILGGGGFGSTNQANAIRLNTTEFVNYWWGNDLYTPANVIDSNVPFLGEVGYQSGGDRFISVYSSNTSNYTSDTPGTRDQLMDDNFLGASYPPFSEYWYGPICEVICYSNVLSSNDRDQVQGYLAWKWGIQNALPSNHPYKNQAPGGSIFPPNPPDVYVPGGMQQVL